MLCEQQRRPTHIPAWTLELSGFIIALDLLTLTPIPPRIRVAMTESSSQPPPDVPAHVFETFLASLSGVGISDSIIASLRRTLLEEKDLSETALRAAIVPEVPPA